MMRRRTVYYTSDCSGIPRDSNEDTITMGPLCSTRCSRTKMPAMFRCQPLMLKSVSQKFALTSSDTAGWRIDTEWEVVCLFTTRAHSRCLTNMELKCVHVFAILFFVTTSVLAARRLNTIRRETATSRVGEYSAWVSVNMSPALLTHSIAGQHIAAVTSP